MAGLLEQNSDSGFSRGISMPNRCSMCCRQTASVSHLFIHCEVAVSLWYVFLNHFQMKWETLRSMLDLISLWSADLGRALSEIGKAIWRFVPFSVCWCLWREKNTRIFEYFVGQVGQIQDKVMAMMFG